MEALRYTNNRTGTRHRADHPHFGPNQAGGWNDISAASPIGTATFYSCEIRTNRTWRVANLPTSDGAEIPAHVQVFVRRGEISLFETWSQGAPRWDLEGH